MAKNAQTLALQRQLLAAGFNPGPLDGIMGPKTRAAQAQFAASQAQKAAVPPPTPAPAPQAVQSAPTPAPGPAANPLYSDPGFLAFAANAGLDYETAANTVARKQAALQNALAVKIPGLQQQGKKQLESVYGGFASRGLYGAGQQGVEEGNVQSQNLQDIAGAQAETTNQIQDLQGGLAQKRQDWLTQAAQKGLDTAGSQDLTNRFNEVDKKYPLGKQSSPTGAY